MMASMSFHGQSSVRLGQAYASSLQIEKVTLRVTPDGSLVPLEPAAWFVCFVPPIDKQFWHRFVHKVHAHVFALRPEREGEWTVFEPWWTRLLVATITTEQAVKFLLWGAKGDVLMVREAIPGHSSQLRGMMTCAALAAHMLGRTYWVWTPHQLYRRLLREPNVCQVDVSALLKADLNHLARENSRSWCDHDRSQGAAKPFCLKCGRDLPVGGSATNENRGGDSGGLTSLAAQ